MKVSPPIVFYCLANWLHRRGCTLLGKLVSWANRFLFSVWVPGSAKIGKRLTLGYWGLGIVIHSKAVIGDDVWISQNVTIGRREGEEGVPVIADGVFIGPNSVVVGEIVLGEACVVGACSFVNCDVPDRAIVAGSPARIIRYLEKGEVYKVPD